MPQRAIRLEHDDLALAARIGEGKINRGVRRAIRLQRYPVCQQQSLLVVYWEHFLTPGLDFEILP
jgi:hypothetical protein